jgi:hypothetical protein
MTPSRARREVLGAALLKEFETEEQIRALLTRILEELEPRPPRSNVLSMKAHRMRKRMEARREA